jgi:hypothetical protein
MAKKSIKKTKLKTKKTAKPSRKLSRIKPKPVKKVLSVPAPLAAMPKGPAVLSVVPSVQAAPPSPVPVREPQRKIVGPGNTITIVPKVTPSPAPESAAPSNSIEGNVVLTQAIQPSPVQAPKIPWGEINSSIPAKIKFVMQMAQKECEQASTWPFPFAKFMACLPTEVCGLEFALLLMSVDRDVEELSAQTTIGREQIERSLENVKSVLDEKFSSICSEMYRKWTTQLGGPGTSVESLVERYAVARVDRNFQIMLGEVLLIVLGAKNPVIEGRVLRDRWSLNPRIIH